MRLITRGDLDGLACAVVITSHEKISEIVLVHPQDISNRLIEVTGDDIIANLPYHPECGLWFDHHLLSSPNRRPKTKFRGRYEQAPSAAKLVWEHYGQDPRFADLIEETNRLDSAQLTEDDVLNPQDYILLGYTIDSRTGLGAFEVYFRHCVEWVKELPIAEVLRKPMVAERVTALGGLALGTARIAAAESSLPEYPLDIVSGKDHVKALADRLGIYAKSLRESIDYTADLGDADTSDLYTEVSRAVDKYLWFLEAHLVGQ